MKIGIMCAIERELIPIAAMLQNHQTETVMQRIFHSGTMHGAEIVAVIGGVGKVNGAITAQLLAERFGVERLIFTGVAGGLDDSLAVGDIVIGTTLLYHDIDMSFISNNMFDTPKDGFSSDNEMVALCRNIGGGLHFGTIITGDQFITGDTRDVLISRFHPLCVDMESAAVAHVCWFCKLPLLIIRCISDFADEDADDTFEKNAGAAGLSALSVMEKVIEKL